MDRIAASTEVTPRPTRWACRMAGNRMGANVLALSQENRRFLSCHGQISCKSLPPSKSWVAPQSLWQRGAAIQMLAPHRNDRRGGFGAAPADLAQESYQLI